MFSNNDRNRVNYHPPGDGREPPGRVPEETKPGRLSLSRIKTGLLDQTPAAARSTPGMETVS
ncbi:MAG: hypothetical protein KAW12_07455 [Candidatus Aminicenantes bacterium]|nr:hypothetical protein [Candidatus Aminicenantes bacterium]